MLGPDVVRALARWRKMRGEVEPTDPVFVEADGSELGEVRADEFRDQRKDAGVTRPELHESSDARDPMDVHGLRRTFVTLALPAGMTESWVRARTGHRSSQMIARYEGRKRKAAELRLGWLAPMDEAIPELKRRRKGAADENDPGRTSPHKPENPPRSGGFSEWAMKDSNLQPMD